MAGKPEARGSAEREILKYLKTHPLWQCTVSQMRKAGGLRRTQVPPAWLRRKLRQMEERGLVYTIVHRNPRTGRETVYYSAMPPCTEAGRIVVGLHPECSEERTRRALELLQEYYSTVGYAKFSIRAPFCELCRRLERELGIKIERCPQFTSLLLRLAGKQVEGGVKLRPEQWRRAKEVFDRWAVEGERFAAASLMMEDLTVELTRLAMFELSKRTPPCSSCEHQLTCLEEGRKWAERFLGEMVRELPEGGLRRFWEGVLAGDLKMFGPSGLELLRKHFLSGMPRGYDPFVFLRRIEEGKAYPNFYSKFLPATLISLAGVVAVKIRNVAELAKAKY